MQDLVQKARDYATQAQGRIHHPGQPMGQAFDEHLRAVANIVKSVTEDPVTLAAAWLHDVVEDTPSTFQDIEDQFGPEVAALVAEVSAVSRPSDGDRLVRQAIDRAHLAQASDRGQTIKLADLIDTCKDLCKHNSEQAKPFVVKMAGHLDVLCAGDAGLLKRARKRLAKSAEELAIPLLPAMAPAASTREPWANEPRQLRTWGVFASAFSTGDVARPLRTFDGERSACEVAERMRALHLDVVGVRKDGKTVTYARLVDLKEGTLEACARPLDARQRIDAGASLSEMIQLLTRHDHGFVTSLGGVNGLVTRADVQQPVVRMWLFGMITLTEMTISARIEQQFPGDAWVEHLSASRLAKAEELRDERTRRGQPCSLLDCLQVGDKADILLKDPDEVAFFGFQSKSTAKKAISEFQSLRNNLAHTQDIVTHDWPQIARMTARVEMMLARD